MGWRQKSRRDDRYSGYGGYGQWAPYVPVGQKIALGVKAAKQLAKKERREPAHIKIEGRKIATTFWGLKWCENLERYQDFSNRLPRGATYVRNGSVADLVIEAGKVRAIVGGSEAYTIEIKINTLAPKDWQNIGRDCAQEIESLLDLMQGKFNEGVMRRLTQAEGGLFPHKKEISMKCSCPDYAGVCKHIAATFYGVAARLDRQPELLFKLRNVDHLELIGQATAAANLDRAFGSGSGNTIADSELGSIFGIELEKATPSQRILAKTKSQPKTKSIINKKTTPTKAKSQTAITTAKPVTKAQLAAKFKAAFARKTKPPEVIPLAKPKAIKKSTSLAKAFTKMETKNLAQLAASKKPAAKSPGRKVSVKLTKKRSAK